MAKKRGYSPEPTFVPLGEGATGIWIGPPTAKEVMLFFHGKPCPVGDMAVWLISNTGGGFSRAAAPSHVTTLWDCAAKVRKSGKDFAIFALAYSMASFEFDFKDRY